MRYKFPVHLCGSLFLVCGLSFYAKANEVPADVLSQRVSDLKLTKTQLKLVEGIIVDSQVKVLLKSMERVRVIGGRKVVENSYPWMVALLIEDTSGNRYQFCGGTLIEDDKILTAAHCNIYPISYVRIFFGDVDIDSQRAEILPIKSFVNHPNYIDPAQGYDIAVITLEYPSRNQAKIALGESGPEFTNGVVTMAKVMGWGLTDENGKASPQLLEADIPWVPKSICKEPYPNIQDGMLCAGLKQGGIDTCQGDSGGPALLIGKNKLLTQVGITSWGEGCARAGYYGVYTRVPSHLPWIKSQL